MLKDRIVSTLQFFDLQDWPLTLMELQRFLVADMVDIKPQLNEVWDLNEAPEREDREVVGMDAILGCLEKECTGVVVHHMGFYHLPGRQSIVSMRLDNYSHGFKRERLVRKYSWMLRHIPFVRGVALSGSQPMGQQKDSSDIDLFIITDHNFLWLARTLVTGYFQIIGKRRHGTLIANRFCLNHYVNSPRELMQFRNMYTAAEYLKLRPVAYPSATAQFQKYNRHWIQIFFPNAEFDVPEKESQSRIQRSLEFILNNKVGDWIERSLKRWQLPKIRKEKFIVVEEGELSFHPDSKQETLLEKYFNK